MNQTDLRALLDERSEPAHAPSVPPRMAGVRARVRAIRRRRAIAAGAAVTVVTAVIWYGLQPPTVDPLPPSADRLVNGFAEYAEGAKVVASATGSTNQTLTLTATAGALGFSLAHRCAVGTDRQVWISFEVNGQAAGEATCGNGGVVTPSLASWAARGIRTGDRVEFRASLSRAVAVAPSGVLTSPVPVPPGEFAVAVMRRVPFEEYPLPARPARLEPLDRALPPTDGIVVNSLIDDPNRRLYLPLPVPEDATVYLVAQTPGTIEVSVDHVVLATCEWWDYRVKTCAVPVRGSASGTNVTVGFTPQQHTGLWRADIRGN